MRRNFAQVLKAGKVDPKAEYEKLLDLFYSRDTQDGKSTEDCASATFLSFPFRGTCLTLEEFDHTHGFVFEKNPKLFDLDYLINFCEYVFNLVIWIPDHFFFSSFSKPMFIEHIMKVVEAVGYMQSQEDNFTIFVPRDNAAIAVSESKLIPDGMSYKVIAYNHHSMKGDLHGKRQTLLLFADLLEPLRAELERIDKKFSSDLFFAFNNFNIRHNNIDASSKHYKKPVAELTSEEMEQIYDEVYQMCLLAFMRLDYAENRKPIDELKCKIDNKE